MRHGDDRAGVLLQVPFEPRHRLSVEVVGRLVEEQDVGLLEQEADEGDAAALAAGEDGHRRVAGRAAERLHRHLELRVDVPRVEVVDLLLELALLGHERVEVGVGLGEAGADGLVVVHQLHRLARALLDDLADGLGLVQLRLLGEVAERDALVGLDGAVELRVEAGDDPEEARLAGPVEAEHADLGPVVEREVDVLEDELAGAVALADAYGGEDDFLVAHSGWAGGGNEVGARHAVPLRMRQGTRGT